MIDSEQCSIISSIVMIVCIFVIGVHMCGLYINFKDDHEHPASTIISYLAIIGLVILNLILAIILQLDAIFPRKNNTNNDFTNCPTSCVFYNVSYHLFGIVSNCDHVNDNSFKIKGCPSYNEYRLMYASVVATIIPCTILIDLAIRELYSAIYSMFNAIKQRRADKHAIEFRE